jgi:hypothetical protein
MLRKTNRIELENKEEPDTMWLKKGTNGGVSSFKCQMDGLFLVSRKH